ncbi:protein FAM151B-like [Uranotaenia lowii]|uniref:protein FAM151B-like n=1 Tax=Uranotaenia lowii TaxID=190385 RepID=UPI00247A558C|nr:protein FAM151B-like [Uranotaenia lowii]
MFLYTLLYHSLIICLLLNHESMAQRFLTDITWAHAVNNATYLNDVLEGSVDFIEADILMGHLENGTDSIPIMAHPPLNQSDLSLSDFLVRVQAYNLQSRKSKGIKLDFKSIEALEKSVEIIKQHYDINTYQTWINADIIPGPVDSEVIPVDPSRFFLAVKALKSVVLSIGWTTKWGQDYQIGQYSNKNVQQMIDVLLANEIDRAGTTLTFPIRAGIAAYSFDQLSALHQELDPTNNVTFTIWSSAEDAVDVKKLRELMFGIGLDKIYLDVPENLKKELNLTNE